MLTRADLMNAGRGYWLSRALLTAVELDLFDALGPQGGSARELAARLDTDLRGTELLLDALAGFGALAKADGVYSVPPEVVPLLTDGSESALAMLRHHARLWRSWDQLTESVREGRPAAEREGFRSGEAGAKAFTLAMREGARRLAPLVAAEVPLAGRRLLLDLGGGPGTYALAFARENPELRVVVVDLPYVCHTGETLVAEEADAEVSDRITYHAADLDADPLPAGADAAFLSHVIHSQSEAEVEALFEKTCESLAPGGLLVVRDFFTTAEGTRPPGAALFGLNMLVNTAAGRTYGVDETAARLESAGFAAVAYQASENVPDTGYLLAEAP